MASWVKPARSPHPRKPLLTVCAVTWGLFFSSWKIPPRKPPPTALACSAAPTPHGPRVSRACSVPSALSHSAVLTCPPFTDRASNPSQVGRWSGEPDFGVWEEACGRSPQEKVTPPAAAIPSASAFPAGTKTGVLTADKGPWFRSREIRKCSGDRRPSMPAQGLQAGPTADRRREPPAAPSLGLPG